MVVLHSDVMFNSAHRYRCAHYSVTAFGPNFDKNVPPKQILPPLYGLIIDIGSCADVEVVSGPNMNSVKQNTIASVVKYFAERVGVLIF